MHGRNGRFKRLISRLKSVFAEIAPVAVVFLQVSKIILAHDNNHNVAITNSSGGGPEVRGESTICEFS